MDNLEKAYTDAHPDGEEAELFTPSNELEPFTSYEEGFSNYTNNYIHDIEVRDEDFRASREEKNLIPKEYKNAVQNSFNARTRENQDRL